MIKIFLICLNVCVGGDIKDRHNRIINRDCIFIIIVIQRFSISIN